jgi:tetratricopeptide (TPR) repeat protein
MRISKNKTVKKQKGSYFADFTSKHLSIFKIFLIFLFFTAITFAIYSNTFDSPFVLDDLRKIEENPGIRVNQLSPTEIVKAGFKSSKARPIAFMTLALNHSMHQYDVFGYHLFNISIHLLTGFFLFLFLKTTLRIPVIQARNKPTDLICFFAALIWLVHPLQSQSVNYIVQRTNSMAAMFFILSFLFYAHGRLTDQDKNKWFWLIASAIAWIISLACKQISAILPFMVFLYEWFFFQDLSKNWIKKYLKYLLGITVIFALLLLVYTDFSPFEKIKKIYDYANNEFTIAERLLTQSRIIIYYISLIIFPHPSRLNLDYDYALSHSLIDPITTLLAFGAICGLIALAVYFAKKERLISFCVLWFFGTHLIESSILPLALIFEHRNYLPTMMVSLIPVVLAYRYIKLDWIKIGLLSALVIGLSVWTYQRNRTWEDKITLWSDVVKKSPGKARPHFNLGAAFSEQKRDEEAIPLYQRALEINPNLAQPHINIGQALERQNKFEEAAEHYRAALKIKPDLPEAHNNIGAILAKQGRTEEAIQFYQEALKIRPHYALAHFNLAHTLVKKGQIEEGIRHYYQAIRFKPEYAEAHNNLGGIYINSGETEKAIKHYIAALQIDPNLVEAYNNLGIALMQEGKIEAAIKQFEKAIQLNPDFIMAENNLKRALALQSELETEISRLEEMLKDNPDNVKLHFRLGNLYFRKGDTPKAMKRYKKALQLNPKFVPALNNLALVTAANQEYYKALTVFLDVLNYYPDHAETHYNIACMYARLKQVDKSIEWLKKAIDKGYTNWESIKKDGDLDNIRDAMAYKELIKDR